MARQIITARLLAIGSELTTGTTRDTNTGELARELSTLGVKVLSSTALPDDLGAVSAAFTAALTDADLVVSTGGLGPTPDDLTREAVAQACATEVHVDPDLLAWLEEMFTRRGAPMPNANTKQAWLIEGASALRNAHGTAPGWWVDRPDGRVIVCLPGPPVEMRPMWRDEVVPRLMAGRLGVDHASHTLHLTGIGESALVSEIGEDILRAPVPQVATYARPDAVDVVVSADADAEHSAAEVVAQMVAVLRIRIGRFVFAEGDDHWPEVLSRALGDRTLATVELGSGGQLAALLGSAPFLIFAELLRDPADETAAATDLAHYAQNVREIAKADIGLALLARQTRDTHVRVAIVDEAGSTELKNTSFQAGDQGRQRAALTACVALWQHLRQDSSSDD